MHVLVENGSSCSHTGLVRCTFVGSVGEGQKSFDFGARYTATESIRVHNSNQ